MAGRKLKVFQAQFGFFDTVVAAPSRAAALRAWGARQKIYSRAGMPASPPTRGRLRRPSLIPRRLCGGR